MRPAFRTSFYALSVGFAVLVLEQGCGRSSLIPCTRDDECQDSRDRCALFRCIDEVCQPQAPAVCDDHDACTDDSCDKNTGACVFVHQSFDLDGDRHFAPKLGFEPSAAGSCGDDCDDTDPAAFPGNPEVCDGKDNDCNGVVDDNATYSAGAPGTEIQISEPALDYAEPQQIARGGVSLLAFYSAYKNGQLAPEMRFLDANVALVTSPAPLVTTSAAASDTTHVWTGDRWGVAWSDRRDGNLEIYFATLDAAGKKIAPGDERITVSDGLSLYPSLAWTGQEFVVVWQEELSDPPGSFTVEAQRIGLDGTLLGAIVSPVGGNAGNRGPVLAAGRKELGLAWLSTSDNVEDVFFAPLGFDLTPVGARLRVTSGNGASEEVSIAYDPATRTMPPRSPSYVIGFGDSRPGARAVYATTVSTDGRPLAPPTLIADPLANSRDLTLLALGDRVVFVYSDDRDQNVGYEIYAHTLSAELTALDNASRVTVAVGHSVSAHLAFAKSGSVAVEFRDDRGTTPAVYVAPLFCHIPR